MATTTSILNTLINDVYKELESPENYFMLCEMSQCTKKENVNSSGNSNSNEVYIKQVLFLREYLVTNNLMTLIIENIFDKKQKEYDPTLSPVIKRRKTGHRFFENQFHAKIQDRCKLCNEKDNFLTQDKEGLVCMNCGYRVCNSSFDKLQYSFEKNQEIQHIKRYERLTHFRANYRKIMITIRHDKYVIPIPLLNFMKRVIRLNKEKDVLWKPTLKWIRITLGKLKLTCYFQKISKIMENLKIQNNVLTISREEIKKLDMDFNKFNNEYDKICPERKYFLNYPYIVKILLEKRINIKTDFLPFPKMFKCCVWNENVTRKIFSKLGWDWWVCSSSSTNQPSHPASSSKKKLRICLSSSSPSSSKSS